MDRFLELLICQNSTENGAVALSTNYANRENELSHICSI